MLGEHRRHGHVTYESAIIDRAFVDRLGQYRCASKVVAALHYGGRLGSISAATCRAPKRGPML